MFEPFGKIARLSREIVITEKIDGTNAQVHLIRKIEEGWADRVGVPFLAENDEFWMLAGSRTRYITPQDDNYGFAKWAQAHAEELFTLGDGRHYGEWWGQGCQRGYGLTEKRFSLFNTNRWGATRDVEKYPVDAPACCHVVPVLWSGEFDMLNIASSLSMLRTEGSVAAPGFMKPEGIVIFHTASGQLFKKTLDKDDAPKGRSGVS